MEPICRIKEIYKALYQFEKAFAERHGITINEAMLLCCLKQGGARTAGTLCDFVGLSGPRVSKVITTVERKGYLHRTISPQDRRQMLFSLTELGAEKIRQMQHETLGFDKLFAQLKAFVATEQDSELENQSHNHTNP